MYVTTDELSSSDNSYRHGGHCYVIFRMKRTWDAAREVCEERHGHLAVPEDNAESQYLATFLGSMTCKAKTFHRYVNYINIIIFVNKHIRYFFQ